MLVTHRGFEFGHAGGANVRERCNLCCGPVLVGKGGTGRCERRAGAHMLGMAGNGGFEAADFGVSLFQDYDFGADFCNQAGGDFCLRGTVCKSRGARFESGRRRTDFALQDGDFGVGLGEGERGLLGELEFGEARFNSRSAAAPRLPALAPRRTNCIPGRKTSLGNIRIFVMRARLRTARVLVLVRPPGKVPVAPRTARRGRRS